MSKQARFALALVILLVLLVFAAMGQDIEKDLDLPVDGKLRLKEKPLTGTPPTPEVPPKPPEDPPPPEQSDEKPPTFYGSEIKTESSSVVLVCDQSGSMGLDGQTTLDLVGNDVYLDRLGRAKLELIKVVSMLPGNWTFSIVSYDCDVRWWSTAMQKATADNKTKAVAWIKAIELIGGTGTGAAVSAALAIDRANKLVILATDGEPSCSQTFGWHRSLIKSQNTQGARIDVFAISAPTGSVMETFCRDIAADNNGQCSNVR